MARQLNKASFLLTLTVTIIQSIFSSNALAANADVVCAFCPEVCGSSSGNQISNGEFFKCEAGSGNTFTIYKNSDRTTHETFRYDSNYIYHVEDYPWSTENGPVTCLSGGNAAGLRFDRGSNTPGMKWVNRYPKVGDELYNPGRVTGKNIATGQTCQTQFSGDIVHGMQLVYRGCITFPTNISSPDALQFQITSGGGVGENFFYDTKRGWVGFDRGNGTDSGFVTSPLDPVPAGTICKQYRAGDSDIPGNPRSLPTGCNPNNPGNSETSRPNACEACNQTGKMTSSCATSFTVEDAVTYQRKEGGLCDGAYWVEKPWGGTIIVDPKSAQLPFAGKKGQENRSKYLADYFEGVCPYYTGQPCPENGGSGSPENPALETGFTALLPPEWQDDLKRALVYRAVSSKVRSIKEGGIHDYLVVYKGFTANLSQFVDHFPPSKDPAETESGFKQRQAAWQTSDGGKWFNLWAAVPMFSREDTLGKVLPYVGTRLYDKTTIVDEKGDKDDKNTISRIPHLARLYEVTKVMNQWLMPPKNQNTADLSTPIVATANTQDISPPQQTASVNSSRLLAEVTCQNANCIVPNIVDTSYDNGFITYALQVCQTVPNCGFVGDVQMGPFDQVKSVPPLPDCFATKHEAYAPPVPITCPGTAVITSRARADRDVADHCRGITIGATPCQVTVDAQCKIIKTTCGPLPPPPPPCHWPAARSVDKCDNKTTFGDKNPKDSLCCQPINLKLEANERFVNPKYTPCSHPNCLDSKGFPIPGCDPNQEEGDCLITETQTVNREVGISLSHPYLYEIWKNTADPKTGFLNAFRLAGPEFTAEDAVTNINYGYTDTSDPKVGSVTPNSGSFYFPYLGGLEKAKRKISANFTLAGTKTNPTDPIPDDGTIIDSDHLGFTVNIRDASVRISDAKKQELIAKVKTSWPSSKIDTEFDKVYNAAIAAGWNPAFVITLWIEESGASGTDAYDFGCMAAEPNNIDSGLYCLFHKVPYTTTSFANFMCMYGEGVPAPCVFDTATNFPKNIKYWYEFITK